MDNLDELASHLPTTSERWENNPGPGSHDIYEPVGESLDIYNLDGENAICKGQETGDIYLYMYDTDGSKNRVNKAVKAFGHVEAIKAPEATYVRIKNSDAVTPDKINDVMGYKR